MSVRPVRFSSTSTKSWPPDREYQKELERQVQETARRERADRNDHSDHDEPEPQRKRSE